MARGAMKCEFVLLILFVSYRLSWLRSFVCDDGKYLIEKDLGGPQNHQCLSGHTYAPQQFKGSAGLENCSDTYAQAKSWCVGIDLTYEVDIPTTGSYRHLPPEPGEYDYLPPQRWLNLLRRGGVAFLYHPCTDELLVDDLRTVAQSCLNYYVMTPYPNLTEAMPLAIVAWGCVYSMRWVEQDEIRDWLETLKVKVTGDYEGITYRHGLLNTGEHPSEVSHLCSNLRKGNGKGQPTVTTHLSQTLPNTTASLTPCSSSSSNRSRNSQDSMELCNNNNDNHQVVKQLQKHSQGLLVLTVLLGLVLLGLVVVLMWKAAVAWSRSRPKKHQKYKSVSKYFPFTHKDSNVDVALPEFGMPKGVGAERQILLEGSDDDEDEL